MAGTSPGYKAAISRRGFVARGAAGSLGLLALAAGGSAALLLPAEARRAQLPLRRLTAAEARTLEALGEVLLPGSAAAGLAHYIDFQLAGPAADSMLMIRYLGVAGPHLDFYRAGLAAVNAAARGAGAAAFAELDASAAAALVARIAAGDVAGWSGPPAGLVYFVLRNDAIDVVYGTPAGFATLGVPYMAHIEPPTPWGA